MPSREPDPSAKPDGTPTKEEKGKKSERRDPDNERSLKRENDSALILVKLGYEIIQNPSHEQLKQYPAVREGKLPDYLIEGEVFDNYAPKTDNVDNIVRAIDDKVASGQTDRIVLNLADSNAQVNDVRRKLVEWKIFGLREVIVIDKQNAVYYIYP